MERSNQGSKLIHYGVPILICIYFILSFYPKYIGNGKEIIPFSLFNLYTFIPYDYANYDLRITDSCGNTRLLFFENKNLTPIERKYYYTWLGDTGEKYTIDNDTRVDSSNFIVTSLEGQVDLVRLSGDYIETINNGSYDLEILKRLK